MTFRQREAQRVFNMRQHLFSVKAAESLLKDRQHLGAGFEAENLFSSFRKEALDFFEVRKIKWHGSQGRPDASIVASQVSCVNCLFPFVSSPESLAIWLQKIYPELAEVL